MGVKQKRQLATNAVPTVFSFTVPQKRRRTTEQRLERAERNETVKRIMIDEDDREELQESLLPLDVMTNGKNNKKDSYVQTENNQPKLKSVKVQCSEPISFEKCTKKNPTLIKISKKTPLNTRSKSCNTDLSFNPFNKVVFTIDSGPVVSTPVKDSDQLSHSFFERQQDIEQGDTSYITDSECEYTESDEESSDNEENVVVGDPISEPKFIVFWSCLVTLFTFCRKCL